MTSFKSQLKLLLWKNWILRKRHKVRLFMEFLWPLILFLILMWVRTRGLKQNRANCHLIEKSLPSVGGFEFFQNFLCTLNNTCHDNYIENEGNQVWNGSLLTKLVNDVSPLVDEIVSSPQSISTIAKLWEYMVDMLQIVGSYQAAQGKIGANVIGKVKIKDLMGKNGRKAFVETVSSYTALTSEQATSLLESNVDLDNANRSSIEEIFETLKSESCGKQKDFQLIEFPNKNLVKAICELDSSQRGLLAFLLGNYIDREALIQKIKGNSAKANVADSKPFKITDFDIGTLSTLSKIREVMKDMGSIFRRFRGLNGTNFITALVYEGICGSQVKGNQSAFGFDPGAANRFNSLRDRLKDWKPDHHYEVDPEISATCNTMFMQLESTPISALLWRQVKPFIRGVIYYTPSTPFTDDLMNKVDAKFEKIRELESGIRSFINILHRARKWLRNHAEDLINALALLSKEGNFDLLLKILGLQLSEAERQQVLTFIADIGSSDFEIALERIDFLSELSSEIMECVKYDKSQGYPTEWEAVNAGSKLLSAEKLWAVVVFQDMYENDTDPPPPHIKYKIRMDSDKVDGTRVARDRLTSKTPRRRPVFDLKYITNGFAYLQEMIEHSIIEIITGQSLDNVSTYLQQFPYPCHIYDQFIRAISRTFPLFMVLSWVYASSMIIKSVVMEKELRLREVMKVMGLGNGVVWCGWFIDSFVLMAISSTVLTIILKYGKVIEHSDVFLIWIFMISYTVATICFSFLVSTFFTKANSAAAAGGILFFVSYLPYNMMLIWEERLTAFHTLIGCLISNVAFGFGCTYFSRYEEDGVGAQWDRITLQTLPGDDFNLSYCILMLWFDSVLYCVLTWYIEAVHPGESGVPKPWNFFLKKSYWKGRQAPRGPAKALYESVPDVQGFDESNNGDEKALVEPEPEGLQVGVAVTNLGKKYSNGKVALTDLSINFYENQITSFLGHNGAGKTTTISILTGLFPPSSGTAQVYGLDIHKDMDSIRHGTGICPQYNCLFDRLTVEEHMQFYAGLKGKWDESFEAEFTQMINDLGIPNKRHEFPKNLSGGMKRKLSVACSFIGGSKTVFLDEPTSGVDPYSRRSIWELLLKYKEGRTIILTTHYMDEADLLGDRIAIISQGKLKACGSSLFLKSRFGVGYSLRIVREDLILSNSINSIKKTKKKSVNGEAASSPTPMIMEGIETEVSIDPEKKKAFRLNPSLHQTEVLKKFIHRTISDATIVDDIGSEIVFLLPYNSLDKFPELFQHLDDNLHHIGVSSYGITDITLEDVFLKITIEDIDANAESFHSLNSRCKRRAMEMLKKWRGDKSRRKGSPINSVGPVPVITIVEPPPPPSLIVPVPVTLDGFADGHLMNGQSQLSQHDHQRHEDIDGNVVPGEETPDTANQSLLEEGLPEDEFPVRANEKPYSSCSLTFIQIYTIFRKRFWSSKRNKKAMFFEIILPAVFIAITLAFTLILPPATDEPPRELSPWTYPRPNTIFFSDVESNLESGEQLKNVMNGLLGREGMGTACIDDQFDRGLCNPHRWSNKTAMKFEQSRMSYSPPTFGNCSCTAGSMQCPNSVENVIPPRITAPSEDDIYDVSKINIAEWIEKTYRKYELSRFGGFELQLRPTPQRSITELLELLDHLTQLLPKSKHVNDISDEDGDFFLDGENGSKQDMKQVFKIWYENRGWVSSVAYLNGLHNMILRENLPEDLAVNKSQFGITVTSHPMNLTKSQSNKESLKTAGLGVIHAICIIFALSFVPASFTVYLIEERKSGGKHLHLVSGVKPITYWIANFIYDIVKYSVPVILCILLFLAFNAKAYIGPPSALSFICLLLLYGWACIPAMYPFSFIFGISSTAFVVLACLNLFIGVVTTISTTVLEQLGDPELEEIGNILKEVFLIFPHYCLGRGLMELVKLDVMSIALDKLAIKDDGPNRFEWDHLGKMLCCLAVQGFVFFFLNLILEYRQLFHMVFKRVFKRARRTPNIVEGEMDEDVAKERNRVLNHLDIDPALHVENLTKYYSAWKKHPAVNGLTFAVGKGECFGLLGVNGAGKTSSFKMLTGDVRITSGKANVCGNDVETSLDGARKHFGYCPQFDGIDPLLDANELLKVYGRLRGMTNAETDIAVRKLIQTLGLTRFANRRSGTFSGGNKRKLSTAIALIGDPDVVFLDEPTSGMDPLSRRKFWKVILRLVRIGKSVVLTTHSMEECEALCSRIAIMVNGQFMCLGSLQHLKNRFGDGYTVTVRCCKEKQPTLISRLETEMTSARLEDSHCSQMKFTIPQLDSKLSDIFNVMYSLRTEGLIEDYSVSQTTLDDIFVKFASHQKDAMDR